MPTVSVPLRATACLIVLLGLGGAEGLVGQCPDGSPAPCQRESPAAPRNSVAVLYFENLSSDSTYAFLADGLTEELIVRLGEVGRLDVRSRFAVRRYRGRVPDDPAAVGRV